MAILRGFPPSNTISPSVRIAEKDLSFIAPEQSFHRAGLVGFASKGPINIPTVIRTKRQLNTIFGFPHPESSDPYLIYAAEQYLLVANELYIVRVGDEEPASAECAQTAEVDIPSAGNAIVVTAENAAGAGYTFADKVYLRWRLNGVLSSKTIYEEAGTYTAAQLAEDLNAQLVSSQPDGTLVNNFGIEFGVDDDTLDAIDQRLIVYTTFSYGPDATLEFVSVADSIYGPTSVPGLGTGMLPAEIVGGNDSWPDDGYTAPGTFDLTDVSGPLTFNIVIDGTDVTAIDNVEQVIDLTEIYGSNPGSVDVTDLAAAITAAIEAGDFGLTGGFEAVAVDGTNLEFRTLHSGRDAKLLVKNDSGLLTVFGFDDPEEVTLDTPSDADPLVPVEVTYYATAEGFSPEGPFGASGYVYGIVDGTNAVGVTTFTVKAESAGIEGNATQVLFTNDVREGVFSVEVYNNGVQVESWGNLTKDSTSRYYVETFLALVSDFIRVEDDTSVLGGPKAKDDTGATIIYTLVGGSDGIPSDPDDQDTILVGNQLGYTGMYALSEPEQIDIDVIAVPGHASTNVIMGLLDVCQNMRMDCLAIIDPPFGLTVDEIVSWQNGTHPLNSTRFDSDFGALYWPWVKIRDTYNNIDVWVPPSGSILAVYARNDQIGAPWFAPAGLTRGIVPGITDVFSRPTLEERDLMYSNRNCINPIVQFSDISDFVVWGQKTLQRLPTALDRVNVRRLMFVAEKRIRAASRQLLFEPHDETLHRQFINIATKILGEIRLGRGITDFIIQADWELNTPDVVDRNEFRARIGIQPVHAVEFIFIEFSIHRTGDWGSTSDTTF
jgi:uncharacterized protein